MIGVAGYFLLYAFFTASKPRPRWLKRTGELLIGIYALAATYTVLQSAEDKEAFLKLVPGSQPMLFVYTTLLAAIGLCCLPGQFVYDVMQALFVILLFSTLLVDARISYWVQRRGIDYWNQLRMLSDNFAIIAGATMYLACSKKIFIEPEKLD